MKARRKTLTLQEKQSLHDLSDRLNKWMVERHSSITSLEEAARVDKGLLSRILNAHQKPSSETLRRIVEALKIPREEYLILEVLAGRIPNDTPIEARHYIGRSAAWALRRDEKVGLALFNPVSLDFVSRRANQYLVAQMLEGYGKQFSPIENPPIPIESIVERWLGVTIFLGDLSHITPPTVGIIYPDEQKIVIDQTISNNRFRYTVAHECGHYLLHTPIDSLKKILASREISLIFLHDFSKSKERAVDEFAAELLMPTHFVIQAVKQQPVIDVTQLVALKEYFSVSLTAMFIQLNELISYNDFTDVAIDLQVRGEDIEDIVRQSYQQTFTIRQT